MKNNILQNLLILIAVFFLVLLDISFFSSMDLYGATLISSFAFLILLAITDKKSNYLFASSVCLLFFTIFSSLPIFLLLLDFLILPAIVNNIKRTYLPEPTVFTSFFYFFSASLFFEIILIGYLKGFDSDGLLTIGYFSILNAFLGVLLFTIYKAIKRYLTGEVVKF